MLRLFAKAGRTVQNPHFAVLLIFLSLQLAAAHAQQLPPAIFSDPPPDKAYPPSMEPPDIISHGKRMNAIVYVASGAGLLLPFNYGCSE